jgi:pyruvate dehydrogenase E1 component alpha subunit
LNPSANAPSNLDVERYLDLHRLMHRIRAFEEAALEAHCDGEVHGAIHPSIGQEAVAVGVCRNLEVDDILLTNHRGHGHVLAKGADPTAMMSELLGRAGGTCQGKGGSMHIADLAAGVLGANGVVAANINIAAGVAHALKLRGEPRIAASIFGDGAINRGPFLEGLNWAKVFALPVLFVCEDNGFASTTRTADMTAGPGPVARAEALGLPASAVDGNDMVAVDEAVRELVAAVRGGGGPRFLLCRTYRLSGHTAADPASYRPAEEVKEAWKRDPIVRLRALLEAAGVAATDLEAQAAEAAAEMAEVYATARAAPWPDAALAMADVQDAGDPRQETF